MTQYATRLITLLAGLSLAAASTWANRMPTPAPPALNASSYLVIDADSGAAVAAMNPDLTGPILLNGAPVQTWAGRVGENPMRYNGGILGGTTNAMLYSDLGHGVFD
ncbi:MAG: DUF3141 domain-containing protein, partial [Pseudomonadota bacterium]